MSRPKEPLKVLNLASLSSLELITLIVMFVYSGIYFVVLFLPQLCYFLELEQRGCCQRVGKGTDLSGMATSSCKAGLLYQRPLNLNPFIPNTLKPFQHRTSFPKCLFKRINCLLVPQPWLSRRKFPYTACFPPWNHTSCSHPSIRCG